MPAKNPPKLYDRIREILESARAGVAHSVSTTQVMANWLIGREIVEEEQRGKRRAEYGEKLLAELSVHLTKDVGKGWSVRNLEYCRNFYLVYPLLLADKKSNAPSSISSSCPQHPILAKFRTQCVANLGSPVSFHSSLSWTHYRTLLRVDKGRDPRVL